MKHSIIFLFFMLFSCPFLFSSTSGCSKENPLVAVVSGTAFLSALYGSVFTHHLDARFDNKAIKHNASMQNSATCLQVGIVTARLGVFAFGTLGFFLGAFSFCSEYSQDVSLSSISSLAYTNAALCLALDNRLTNSYHQKECSNHIGSQAKR